MVVAVDSPPDKATRVLTTTAEGEGAESVQDGTVLVRKDKTVIPCDEPAGILSSHEATCLSSISKSSSSKDKDKPLLEAPSDISPLINPSQLDPNRATKSLPSPNPPSTVGLSSIFDKLLCLKRKSPPTSPSNVSPPLKLQKPDHPVEAFSSPAPNIPYFTPGEFEAFIQPGILSLAQPTGDSGKARKSAARRASSFKRKGILNEVPIVPSFQHNQQDLLGFSIDVTPIANGDGISPTEASNVSSPHGGENWTLSCIYFHPDAGTKAQAWSHLRSCSRSLFSLWLCIGDFNEVSSSKEKWGGLPVSSSRLEAFNGLVSDCSLLDLEFKGLSYTWSNNRSGLDNIRERIDRALANAEWRVMFPYAQVFQDAIIGSDHSPLLLDFYVSPTSVRKAFKFESLWTTSPNCLPTIKDNWPVQVQGSAMFRWSSRLKALKKNLAPTAENLQVQQAIHKTMEIIMAREEMYLHQRSRVNWLNYGDRNSKFFYTTLIQRRQRNQILRLKAHAGVWKESEDDINLEIHHYFTALFENDGPRDFTTSTDHIFPKVTGEMNRILTKQVNNEEIRVAVFQMGALKAPGPNGYPGLFFQKFWNEVGGDTCLAVKSFFQGGFLLKKLNHTNIVLIPKVPHPESLSQFRPISLCNFSVKIISKVLANRLKKFLNGIITPYQSAFVPGRQIQDNILVAHEAFHFLKRKRRGKESFAAIKLDLSKGYDRVQWDFLEVVMRKIGLCDMFIHWVMQIVSTVFYTVTANGKNRFSFLPSRGLRQGDPLSPYLFLIIMDVLSVMLCNGIRDNLFNGLKIKRGFPLLSHVMFVDDVLLFVSNGNRGIHNLKNILDQFCIASGQLINFEKSSICFSANTSQDAKRVICNILNIPIMGADSKYLGLPFFWGRSKSEAYMFLIEKAITKMQGWKTKDLNVAGKETLIKHVIQAIPSYAMACFSLSQKFCNKLNKYVRRFWCSGSPEDAKIHWVNGDDLCKAKNQGGLGFRDFKSFNLALLAKQGWRLIQNPNAFWARLLKSLYFPNGNFLKATKGSRPSWAWASLLKGRELLMKGVRWQIQNGASVDFWVDKWVPSLPSFCIQSTKPPWVPNNKVADFINPTSGEWRIAKLRQVLSEEEIQAVTNIPISKLGGADAVIWGLHPSGKYTVKRGYHKAWSDYIISKPERPSTSNVPGPSFWNFLWNLKIPPKLKHFWWRACRNKLATKENLVQRKCAISPICQRCGKAIESSEHILFLCKWARKVFFASPLAGVFFPNEIGSVLAWSLKLKEEIDKGNLEPDIFTKTVFLCWFIWKARNDLVFQSLKQSPVSIVARAMGAWDEFISATETISSTHQSRHSSPPLPSFHWIPPGAGSMKINCDASWSKDLKRGWGGIILRDDRGHLVDGRRFRISASSAFLAEASVLREACLFAKALNLSSVCIENDNVQLISLSVSELVPPWQALAIISDIRLLASELRLSFCWTPREGNEAAHWIASSKASSLGLDWVVSPPAVLFSILCNDALVYQ
ncbi:hypothetical protein RHSIM_Rhsim06G0103400 [Rhododendron simsii]|uniref:Reverse transcriptase domain-containing protein n=1 Tax=Rhododendron simsii TaxID=118357 RepID=A0A834LK45_RHOSS|nr:hypothetical protein RHSIM_Rhsim06G0103400 [Rhododendron simsii]